MCARSATRQRPKSYAGKPNKQPPKNRPRLSATISCFCSIDHRRRLSPRVINSTRGRRTRAGDGSALRSLSMSTRTKDSSYDLKFLRSGARHFIGWLLSVERSRNAQSALDRAQSRRNNRASTQSSKPAPIPRSGFVPRRRADPGENCPRRPRATRPSPSAARACTAWLGPKHLRRQGTGRASPPMWSDNSRPSSRNTPRGSITALDR